MTTTRDDGLTAEQAADAIADALFGAAFIPPDRDTVLAILRRVRPAPVGDWRAEAAEIIARDRLGDENSPGLEDLITALAQRAHAAGAEQSRGLLRECRGYLSRGHTHPAYRDELIVRIDAHLGQQETRDGR